MNTCYSHQEILDVLEHDRVSLESTDRRITSLQRRRCVRARRTGLHVLLAFICLFFVHVSSAYDMVAVDVSNTTFYKELSAQGLLVTDHLHEPLSHIGELDSREVPSGSGNTTDSIPDATGLPSPFDTSLGNNFTDTTCPTFFTTFLNNATFQTCLPVSLLLQNSMSFFKAAQSTSQLNHALDVSCAASLAICSPLMSYLARQLIASGNCQNDYKQQNPLVLQAYAGLTAYEPVYKAACLKDASTNEYCFTEALTNTSNPSDAYPYYTAVGLALPSTAQPSCSSCLRQTMQIFAGYAVQKAQPLSQTYLACAAQVDHGCGNTFASTQLQTQTQSTSAACTMTRPRSYVSTLVISIVLVFFLV